MPIGRGTLSALFLCLYCYKALCAGCHLPIWYSMFALQTRAPHLLLVLSTGHFSVRLNRFMVNCYIFFTFIFSQPLLDLRLKNRHRVLLRLFSHCKGKSWVLTNRQRLCKVTPPVLQKIFLFSFHRLQEKRVFVDKNLAFLHPLPL